MVSRLLLFFLFSASIAFGQPKIHGDYEFQDGIYTSHLDLFKDQPSHPLYALPNFGYQLDRQQNLLFLSQSTLEQLDASKLKNLDAIWGICVRGVPYVKIQPKEKSDVVYFARYHIVGRISYFYYPTIEDEQVDMPIYDPWIGQRVGGRIITNRERRLIKKIMWLETGEVRPYTVADFRALAKSDQRLMRTLDEMTPTEATKKLFKTIQIFNDRNPILLKKR